MTKLVNMPMKFGANAICRNGKTKQTRAVAGNPPQIKTKGQPTQKELKNEKIND